MAAEAEVHTVKFINKDGRNSHLNKNKLIKFWVSNFHGFSLGTFSSPGYLEFKNFKNVPKFQIYQKSLDRY